MADTHGIITKIVDTIIKDAKIQNPDVKIKDVDSGGANFSSTIHLITVKSPGQEDLELFAKVAGINEQARAGLDADDMYAAEQVVYKHLSKIYDRIQTEKNIPENERYVFPKFYGGNSNLMEETLVLDNLVAKGYVAYDRFKSIDWEYASLAVEELAKFHALSIAFADNDPLEFKRMADKHKFWFSGTEQQLNLFKTTGKKSLEVVSEKYRSRLEKFLERYLQPAEFIELYSSNRCPVLVHGDYRVSNLLHKEKDGKAVKVIPVDYQVFHKGSPVADLMYFIFYGSDGEFRRNHYQQLLDHYYATFSDFLRKLGLDARNIYPREHYDEDLKKKLPLGLVVGSTLMSVILVDAESAPKIGDEAANMDNFAVQPNSLYKQRLEELVDDFVAWGVL